MTLKARILTLWCRGRSYDEIVEMVGVRREYVRACVSRARHGGRTPGDIASSQRYAVRKRQRYHADPQYRQHQLDKNERWRKANRERHNAYHRERQRRRRAELKAQNSDAPARGSQGVGDLRNCRVRHSETN